MAHCSLISRDKFVWLDETGTDARDHIRTYGYVLRGMRAVTHCFLSEGKILNAIAAMSQDGVIALELVSGSVNNREVFFDFVRSALVPIMMPFNGVNFRSVLMMDNCSVHHVNVYYSKPVLSHCLPPYSPDSNTAEVAFSYSKKKTRYVASWNTITLCTPSSI